MALRATDLWRWDGTIDRASYAAWGVGLLVLKYVIDRELVRALSGETWSFLDLQALSDYLLRRSDPAANPQLALVLAALALPFMWTGFVLTLRRLRSSALPLPLAALYFVPVIKLCLFAFLCIAPSAEARGGVPGELVGESRLARWMAAVLPQSAFGSAMIAAVNAAATAGVLAWLSTNWLRSYGWALFVGLPFGIGFTTAFIHGYRVQRSFASCAGATLLSLALLSAGFLLFAMEGAICLLMAAPLAIGVAFPGTWLGWAMQNALWKRRLTGQMLCVGVLFMPMLLGVQQLDPAPPPLLRVTTAIEIAAPPGIVWRHVVAFADLPPPHELLFRLGIAYPLRARINGEGVGAVRQCEFSTGTFVEPIVVWDEPRLLKFSVTANPPPMEEWTPYRHLHPPHLDGFLRSDGGQFRLLAHADGQTRLEGTTWYRHHMWPAAYWQLWSDTIIHAIHRRVLAHIAQLAEAEQTCAR